MSCSVTPLSHSLLGPRTGRQIRGLLPDAIASHRGPGTHDFYRMWPQSEVPTTLFLGPIICWNGVQRTLGNSAFCVGVMTEAVIEEAGEQVPGRGLGEPRAQGTTQV